MKKIIMTFAAAMVAMAMDAQIYAGGTVGFVTESTDGNSESTLLLQPEVGYNFAENLAVGIVFGYGESGKDEHKLKTFTINPYLRYTALKFDKVNIFLDGEIGYTNKKYGGVKTNIFEVGVKPGVAINLNEKLSLVTHVGFLGYQNSKPDYDGAKATNTFGVSVDGNSLDFGIYYNF